ncbi:MAG: hypothetical protein EOP04_29410, partial [Proteobacteria bacterium]
MPEEEALPESPEDLVIEQLTREHRVRKFDCGNDELNQYIARHAKTNTDHGHCRAYVAIKPGHPRVWAYYTLTSSAIDVQDYTSPIKCPQKVSCIRIGRMAVESSLQGMAIGTKLMIHALKTSVKASEIIGVHAVVLDPK